LLGNSGAEGVNEIMSELKPCPSCENGGNPRKSRINETVACMDCGFCAHSAESWNARASGFISINESLPELSEVKSSVEVIVKNSIGEVFACDYSYNKYAKNEKGREPRWERHNRIYDGKPILEWMPLPKPEKE
jgi:hypothetical protein